MKSYKAVWVGKPAIAGPLLPLVGQHFQGFNPATWLQSRIELYVQNAACSQPRILHLFSWPFVIELESSAASAFLVVPVWYA